MAASFDSTLIPDNSTDARFRAWGSRISTALAASGWIQTADTGQINWTTVTHPTSANASQGYEIWRMNDALQATQPIYLKIEYGSGTTTSLNVGIFLTLGSGSNGAGTLTNPGTRNACGGGNDTVPPYTCYFSGTSSRFNCCMFGNGANQRGFQFHIERSKDSSGNDSTSLVILQWFQVTVSSNNWSFQIGSPSANQWRAAIFGATGGNANCMPCSGVVSGVMGTDLAVFTVLPSDGGAFLNAPVSIIGYFNADFSQGVTFQVSMYGTLRTFMALGAIQPWGNLNRYALGIMGCAMLYE